jgi:elongation factor P--beta-lysine ligase
MLELYKVGADYMDISEVVLELIQGIAKACHPEWNEGSKDGMLRQAQHDQYKITYQGTQINLSRWEKMTVAEAFQKYAEITEAELFDHVMFREAAKRKGYAVEIPNTKYQIPNKTQVSKSNVPVGGQIPNNLSIDPVLRQAQHDSGDDKQGVVEVQRRDPDRSLPRTTIRGEDDSKGGYFTYEELWSQIYSNEVEPHLGKKGYPTLLYDYPVEFAALSKPNPDGKTAQRFEFYIAGIELGNCYSELTEWPLQEERLRKEQQERAKSGKISHPTDWGFIESLKKGLPECSGIAIGVDRLAMIFANVDSIEKLKLVSL